MNPSDADCLHSSRVVELIDVPDVVAPGAFVRHLRHCVAHSFGS